LGPFGRFFVFGLRDNNTPPQTVLGLAAISSIPSVFFFFDRFLSLPQTFCSGISRPHRYPLFFAPPGLLSVISFSSLFFLVNFLLTHSTTPPCHGFSGLIFFCSHSSFSPLCVQSIPLFLPFRDFWFSSFRGTGVRVLGRLLFVQVVFCPPFPLRTVIVIAEIVL